MVENGLENGIINGDDIKKEENTDNEVDESEEEVIFVFILKIFQTYIQMFIYLNVIQMSRSLKFKVIILKCVIIF